LVRERPVIPGEQVFRPAPGVETAHFGGEVVVLDATGRMLRGLNATGALVWKLLDGKRSVLELARTLAETQAIDEAQALRDVRSFLTQLAAKNLVSAEADR
jgi:pyrroloquinoline quinone biosynthesis protein D